MMVMQRRLTSFRDTPKSCQSSPVILVNLRCISTAAAAAAVAASAVGSQLSWRILMPNGENCANWRIRHTDENLALRVLGKSTTPSTAVGANGGD
jgi:hypothetical protein